MRMMRHTAGDDAQNNEGRQGRSQGQGELCDKTGIFPPFHSICSEKQFSRKQHRTRPEDSYR